MIGQSNRKSQTTMSTSDGIFLSLVVDFVRVNRIGGVFNQFLKLYYIHFLAHNASS